MPSNDIPGSHYESLGRMQIRKGRMSKNKEMKVFAWDVVIKCSDHWCPLYDGEFSVLCHYKRDGECSVMKQYLIGIYETVYRNLDLDELRLTQVGIHLIPQPVRKTSGPVYKN